MNLGRERAIEARLDAAAEACAREGAQLTELRRFVLRLVLATDGAITAYALLDRLKETRGGTPSTIYRALDFLIDHGLIHKIERLNAFIACTDAGHQHQVQFLVCQRCGTVAEIEDVAVSAAIARAAEREGFRTGHAGVEVEGTCAACSHPP